MLAFGTSSTRDCRGLSRRSLLTAGSLAAWGLSWPRVQRSLQAAELKSETESSNRSGPKSIILLWLWGGPSQIDTFDMKPHSPVEYRGPFATIPTNVPGIDVCELFPQMARCADRYSIIRTMHTTSNDHGIAGTIGLTGGSGGGLSLGGVTMPGRLEPTQGAIVSRFHNSNNQLPGFVAIGGYLHQGKRPIAGEGGGPLGALYDPFRLDYVEGEGVKLPQLEMSEGLNGDILGRRMSLLQEFDEQRRSVDRKQKEIERLDSFYQQAYSLLTSTSAREVFDLESEAPELRQRYGSSRFGQSCLLARRLVETGIPFVQVNWSSHVEPTYDGGDGGWDMHDRNFSQMENWHGWTLDMAYSSLLEDLESRGLLESTMVVALGEFGRGPRINVKAGRDHWEHCYTALVAGGGFPGGTVIGESDKYAEYPRSRAYRPSDLISTVLLKMGITTPQLTELGLVPNAEAIGGLL